MSQSSRFQMTFMLRGGEIPRMFMRLKQLIPALFCLCLSTGISSANNFSFVGVFSQDDQLEFFMFTAPSANVTVRTWGYAGGTNADGQLISAGGFDPILSV